MRTIYRFLLSALIFATSTLYAYPYFQPFAPYYSQGGQDKYVVEELFHHMKNGIFFDIGAHDGVSYSNTYYLENNLGWSGVCVEPQDENFTKLLETRKCICLHGCVFNTSGTKEFLKVNGPSEMLSGLLESYDPRHLERAKAEVKERGGSLEVVLVEAYTFNEICQANNITHIDFLSVDTEGSEEMIIKSIDLQNIDITVIAVENNYQDTSVYNYLITNGYRFDRTVAGDNIYIKN